VASDHAAYVFAHQALSPTSFSYGLNTLIVSRMAASQKLTGMIAPIAIRTVRWAILYTVYSCNE